MTFKEFKDTLSRPPYQVIKKVIVQGSVDVFVEDYPTLDENTIADLNTFEVTKVEINNSEDFHVFLKV